MGKSNWASYRYSPHYEGKTYDKNAYPVTSWHKDTPHIKTTELNVAVDDSVMQISNNDSLGNLAKVVPNVWFCSSCRTTSKHYAQGMCRNCYLREYRKTHDRTKEYMTKTCPTCGGSVSRKANVCRTCYEQDK